jgi:hypothetical protein
MDEPPIAFDSISGGRSGDNRSRVVDPFGHHWEIGKPLGPGVGE